MVHELLLYEPPLPAHALLLYLVLRELPSDTWSTDRLAEIAGISRASVFRNLKILEKRILIERKRIGRSSNSYRIIKDKERFAIQRAAKSKQMRESDPRTH